MDIIETLREIYATRGYETYEGDRRVTQTSHGLQTAMIAEAESASPAMVTAALLHDIGRIINPKDRALTDSGKDAKHEDVGRKYLEPWFGPEVTMPIKWHVAAKRYLVATDPAYAGKISAGSTRSLKGQGGLLTPEEAAAFLGQPYAAEGVQLRRWDDRAKRVDAETPPFDHFVPALRQCLAEGTGSR
jgi:phosphonate degradation associated HDIG domain protein